MDSFPPKYCLKSVYQNKITFVKLQSQKAKQ